ncbi:hypothetical protein [Ancylobacter sp. IITR112]|uniref:hypothetical protein n=1 Tax=Ancylobacter sp. IITR112 TaxID=3138073 RepID=UPI00352A4F85
MRPTTPRITHIACAGAFAGALMLSGGVQAQTTPGAGAPAADPARFSMQPVEGGLMRLDTRTGAMSFCSQRAQAWVCEAVPDDRAALEAEIGRLQARIAALEKGGAGVPDIMAPPQAGPEAKAPDANAPDAKGLNALPPSAAMPGGEEELPAQARQRLDQAVDLAEHAFRRFVEMIERLRKDLPQEGAPLPPPPKGEGL